MSRSYRKQYTYRTNSSRRFKEYRSEINTRVRASEREILNDPEKWEETDIKLRKEVVMPWSWNDHRPWILWEFKVITSERFYRAYRYMGAMQCNNLWNYAQNRPRHYKFQRPFVRKFGEVPDEKEKAFWRGD